MRKLRILTFNHHESYLRSLSETGHDFDVVVRYKGLDLSWNQNQKVPPRNFSLVEFNEKIQKRLLNGYYDVVICHTLKNLLWLFSYKHVKFIFVAHIPLFKHTLFLRFKSLLKKAAYQIFKLTHRVHFFGVSEFKRKSWGEKGTVAVLSPEPVTKLQDGVGYGQIIVVCNQLVERGIELGWPVLETLLKDYPIKVIGNNPSVPDNVYPKSFAEFQELFRSGRIYLYTIEQPYGDGYNTAMLEAMQMGMAIVTIANPSTPVIHEKNGLIGRDGSEVRVCLDRLLNDQELVDRLGHAAKGTVSEQFSKEKFLQGWQKALTTLSKS